MNTSTEEETGDYDDDEEDAGQLPDWLIQPLSGALRPEDDEVCTSCVQTFAAARICIVLIQRVSLNVPIMYSSFSGGRLGGSSNLQRMFSSRMIKPLAHPLLSALQVRPRGKDSSVDTVS